MKARELVSKSERKEIAKNEKYVFVPEGVNMRTKVIDVGLLAEDYVEERRKKGESMVIHVTPLIPRNNRSTNKGITFVKDAINNVVYGIMVDLDRFKNIIWARIEMEDGITINLDNIEDAKRWMVIRMHPSVEGSPFENEPLYKVEDPTLEAKKTQQKVSTVKQLFDKIDAMNGKEIVDALRYLGETVNDSLTLEVAKSNLYNLAINNPSNTAERLANKQRGIEAKILAAVDCGVIKEFPEKGYVYNEINLGINMREAVNFIEKDKNVLSGILTQVEEEDVVSQNIQSEYDSLIKKGNTKKVF
jgi:hypothetical protein